MATDGYRLARKKIIKNVKSEIKVTIPAPSLQEVIRSLSDDMEEIEISFNDDLIRFRLGELEIISKFIPKEPDRKEILEKLKNEISELQMGPAMGIAKKLFPSVSGATLSGIVKEILGK